MAEEFQESEVMFHENLPCGDTNTEEYDSISAAFYNSLESANSTGNRRKLKRAAMVDKRSVPLKIPGKYSWLSCVDADLDGDDGEMVPPHVIVARRVAEKMMAFSVCTGNGGTLKGRNMSEVRDSILRMTGFLET